MSGRAKNIIHGSAIALAEIMVEQEKHGEAFHQFYLRIEKQRQFFLNRDYFVIYRDATTSIKEKQLQIENFLKAVKQGECLQLFCLVLLKNHILHLLPEIIENFLQNGISRFADDIGLICSKRSFTIREIKRLEQALQSKWQKKNFKLFPLHDPMVNNGFVIKTNNQKLVNTIYNKVNEMKKSLSISDEY